MRKHPTHFSGSLITERKSLFILYTRKYVRGVIHDNKMGVVSCRIGTFLVSFESLTFDSVVIHSFVRLASFFFLAL